MVTKSSFHKSFRNKSRGAGRGGNFIELKKITVRLGLSACKIPKEKNRKGKEGSRCKGQIWIQGGGKRILGLKDGALEKGSGASMVSMPVIKGGSGGKKDAKPTSTLPLERGGEGVAIFEGGK